jgi:hydroxymethylpyrimidine/phosphomethylpyrimidine kinase
VRRRSAQQAGKPWALDPVAVGALTLRTEFCRELLALQPAAVRGNASEIMALAGMSGGGRGVDTTDTAAAALPAAQALARQLNTVVAVTGEVDYVTDGQRTRAVTGGDPLMTRVVGTGCALSAVVAAAAAMPGDRLENVAAACGLMKLAGESGAAGRPRQLYSRLPRCALCGRRSVKRINALTIAGTDPSGGAGIQADLKTFSALGAYGCSVITALVAQNTRGVQSVYRIEPDFVAAQLDSVFSDVRIDTTKIGMLAETDIVEAVAERLARYQIKNVVLDTVMLAKSGDPLLSASAVETLRQRLLPQVSLITPNLPEAAALLDAPHARTEQEMLEQGRALLGMGCGAVLMKAAISMMRKARTGSLPATGSSALPRRESRPKTPTVPAVRCRRRWRPCVRVTRIGGEPWRKPRAGCRRRWRRRIRWKWGTASVRSTISTPGGKRQDNVSADYAEKIGSRLENLLSRYQA